MWVQQPGLDVKNKKQERKFFTVSSEDELCSCCLSPCVAETLPEYYQLLCCTCLGIRGNKPGISTKEVQQLVYNYFNFKLYYDVSLSKLQEKCGPFNASFKR